MNFADLKDPVIVPEKLVGLSGPGSKDPDPEGNRSTGIDLKTGYSGKIASNVPVPRGPKDIPSEIASGAVESVKSIGRGVKVLNDEVNPVGPDGFKIPMSGLVDPHKRREFERGASDVVTGGLAEKAADAIHKGWRSTAGLGTLGPTFEETAKEDAAKAPGYRDAGGVVSGLVPNPIGEAVSIAVKPVGMAVKSVAEKLAPAAESRIFNRSLSEMSKGAPSSVREQVGPSKSVIKEIAAKEPELMSTPKDPGANEKKIQSMIDSRTAELDRRYQAATDKYVSGVPEHVDEPGTVRIDPSSVAPKSRQIEDTQGRNPLLTDNDKALTTRKEAVPYEVPEEPTVKIDSKSVGGSEPRQNVIEMRPNGSLAPHEVKASISSKIADLERRDSKSSDALSGILHDFDRELGAEIKATHDDPSLRWYRQQATKHQHLGEDRVLGQKEATPQQKAHSEIADLIRDHLEKHMQDPEVDRLNKEVSALIRLKNVNKMKLIKEEAPGNTKGVYGSRLHSMFKAAGDVGSVALALGTHNPLPLIVPAAIHGGPVAASIADQMIAKIASASASGRPTESLVEQALKSGISQTQIDSAIDSTDRAKKKNKQ